MAQLKDLIVSGPTRLLNDLYVQNSIQVTTGIKIGSANELKSFGTGLSINSSGVLSCTVTGTITGSGTNGYLTKWNGGSSITNGPQLGSDTTKFLNNAGGWTVPANTTYSAGTGLTLSDTTFSLNTASTSALGGIKVGEGLAINSGNSILSIDSTGADEGDYFVRGTDGFEWHAPSWLPLTGGTLARSTAATSAVLTINQTYATATSWISGLDLFAPSMSPNSAASYSNFAAINFGREGATNLSGNLTFHYTSSSDLTTNWISLGLNGNDHILCITGKKYVGINKTAPATPLDVVSTSQTVFVGNFVCTASLGTGVWARGISTYATGLGTNGHFAGFEFGRSSTTRNSSNFVFNYVGDGNVANNCSWGFCGVDDILVLTAQRRMGINTTAPGYDLDVSGNMNASGTITVAGRNVLRTFGPTDGETVGYDGLVPSPGTDGGRVLTGDSGWGKVTDSYLSGRFTMAHMPAGTNGQVLIAKGTSTNPAWGNLTVSLAKTGTASINLSSNTVYTLTVGNSTYAFKTPVDNVGPCLIEGTKILMADGSEKNIEDVVEGDLIRSYDPATEQLCEAIVIANRDTGRSNDYVNYYFEDGSFLTIFGDHLLYSANEGTARINTAWEPGWTAINAQGEQVTFIGTEDVSGVGHKRHYDLHSSNKLYYANGILNAQSLTSDYMRFFNPDWPESYKAALKEDYDISVAVNQHKTNRTVGAQMVPLLKELKKQKKLMDENKKLLADSDYIVAKFTEGLISATEWLKAKTNRASWRQLVNDAETAYNAAKARYSQFKSQFNPSTTRSERFAAAVARDNACLADLKAYYAAQQRK